jgi:AcrR family transcriptional regulator
MGIVTTQPSTRRLPPDARRRQIIDTARRLISERGDAGISTADVAEAAGVTRALVHHYFRGIDELLDAVTQELLASVEPLGLTAATGVPIQERVPHNIAIILDMIEANRDVWLAALAADTRRNSARSRLASVREELIESALANNADTIADTPWARLCLTGHLAFVETIARGWQLGEASREDAQRALTDTLLHLLLHTIPGR